MGASASSSNNNNANKNTPLDKTEEEIVLLMMPVYYCADILTRDEHKMASDSWQLILNNTAPGFVHLKSTTPNFKFTSSILFFYDTFYQRLFDIHPLARDLFKDAKSQGKFLVKMISLSLSEHNDVVKYEKTLIKLAEIHNERGVKAIECKPALPTVISFTKHFYETYFDVT